MDSGLKHFRVALGFAALVGSVQIFSNPSPEPFQPGPSIQSAYDFNPETLLAAPYKSGASPGFSFLQPNRFSMHQSYSLGFTSSGAGSTSSGVYLNTLSYQIAEPLKFSIDVGVHTPIHSTVPGLRNNSFMNTGTGTSLVLPRMGLEYKPSDRFQLNLEFFQLDDAVKAYGSPYGAFGRPW